MVCQELLQSTGEIPLIVAIMIDSIEREADLQKERYPSRDRRPPRRRGVPSSGQPPDRPSREPSGEGGLPDRGRPPDRGGLPSGGGPPDDGGPPGDGGSSSGNGGPPRCPNRRGTPGPRGPPGPVRPVLIQQPQVVLDTTALENTFDNMGQSKLQLARVQDQTNRHLQQHIQQGQLNMQAHAGALHELANSTIREIMTTYLLAYLSMMEVIEMTFFHG